MLIPIPDRDFDPTEVAVSWQVLRANGHRVVFATESGAPGVADDIMVSGRGLDFWSALPVLGAITVVGRMLRANKDARRAYQDMLRSAEYQHPSSWMQTTLDGIDGLLLPGGHRAAECAPTSTVTCCTASSSMPLPVESSWPRSATACCSLPAAWIPRPVIRCSTGTGLRR